MVCLFSLCERVTFFIDLYRLHYDVLPKWDEVDS